MEGIKTGTKSRGGHSECLTLKVTRIIEKKTKKVHVAQIITYTTIKVNKAQLEKRHND